MHPLELQTLNIIKRDTLIPNGSTVIIGVSAGCDSVALLVVLSRLREQFDSRLIAVYVDHGLRPDEVDRERKYVQSLAGLLDVMYESSAVPASDYATSMKLSLEHAARTLRYQALRDAATRNNAALIATAHTADDQAEEVLIRLLRGGGRKGLSGMRTKNNDIIRPFLETEKVDIVAYLTEKNIDFLEDSSNSDPRFLRNRVRHELIPYLEQYFDPGVKQALRKTAGNLAEDETLLEELTDNAMRQVLLSDKEGEGEQPEKMLISRFALIRLPSALQRRVIEQLLWRIGDRARYSHIVQVVAAAREGRPGSELHLSKGLRLGVQKHYLEFVYPEGRHSWRGRLYDR